MKNVLARIVTGSACLAITIGFFVWDLHFESKFGLLILGCVLVCGALHEFYDLAGLEYAPRGLRRAGVLLAALYLARRCVEPADAASLPVALGLTLAAGFILHVREAGFDGVRDSVFPLVAGFVYLPLMVGHAFDIRHAWGLKTLLAVALITKASDMAGWLFGNLIGGKKLAPKISPNKTWSGFLGGLVGCCLMALLMRGLSLIGELSVARLIALALVLGVAGPLSDLAESALKRDAGVKDSGSVLRVAGGFLDLIDSLVFALPAGYYFLYLCGLPGK